MNYILIANFIRKCLELLFLNLNHVCLFTLAFLIHKLLYSRLYFWTGTQFDMVLSLTLKGKSKSVAAWESDKVLFMAVSLFDRNQLQILQLKESVGK